MAYRTVGGPAKVEESVKGSRFLGYARSLASVEEFEPWLQALREEHRQANHHCWAYRFAHEMRFSDDGEPGGTAGRPMLEVLLKRDLDRVAVVVVRYFGGTKLGAGGLARAYGGTAAKVLDGAGEEYVEDREELAVHVPFSLVDPLLRLLADRPSASILHEQYDARGLHLRLELPKAEVADFRQRLADLSRGAAEVEEIG